jgi:tRNA pseudouridine38-40 synthase
MYLGQGFNGYQKQKEGITIQGKLEDALSLVFKEDIDVVGCGRTDTGVSAKEYYFHFDSSFSNPESKLYSLNGILGENIAIQGIEEVDTAFHARFDATLRGYEYYLHMEKNPFLNDSSYFFPLGSKSCDLSNMERAAELLLKHQDFFTFCKTHSDVSNTLCDITLSQWIFSGTQFKYTIHGNRFLRGMVRMIVGAMLNIGLGKISIEELETALSKKQRLKNSWSVPAHGLYLYKVEYPIGSFKDLLY